MIRSNLPLPFLYRFRLQAGSAARRAQSSLVNYRQARDGAASGRSLGSRPNAARRTAGDAGQLWADFVDQYECFTGVLCAAAQLGCTVERESEYAQMRRWFMANYYRLAARVRPYLDEEFAAELQPGEAASPTVTDYAGQKRSLDVLEALFLPPTLRDVLRYDTGNLIPHIARISSVVYQCHEDWQAERDSA
jgi:hypothetical protein